MLKKYLSSSIIVLIQFIALGAIVASITPLLIHNSNLLKQINAFLDHHQTSFLLSHSLFYLTLYLSWPKIVKLITVSQPETPNAFQINKAIQIRLYLLAIFLSIELINFLR